MRILDKKFLTYDDLLIKPNYSEVLPGQVNLSSKFTKNVPLNIPLVSAAMDSVTEHNMAIAMAEEGGIGVIHKNMMIDAQAKEVLKVKKYEGGIVDNPVTVSPTQYIVDIEEMMKERGVTSVLVTEGELLVGILTRRDLNFVDLSNKKVSDLMTRREQLITAPENISLEEAKKILLAHKVEKLPLVDKDFKLKGLITIKDLLKKITHPLANRDSLGRLRVAATIGTSAHDLDRADALVKAGVDALVIDTAHGHSKNVYNMIKNIKGSFAVDLVAGNVATAQACQDLIDLGVDGIKVGIGPGSICTTRVVAGIGVPQFSALLDCQSICMQHHVPFIADGGIKYSGDIVKALAVGAASVMIGSLLAGSEEAPGELVLYKGRSYKVYRGMGSLPAMRDGSKDRYMQADVSDQKLVPEGVEGQVPYRGKLSSIIYQLVGGIRAGMGYTGAANLRELYQKAEFITITSSSLAEGHPHDVFITKEAPNYSK